MLERTFERALFASRWLLAPFYAALGIGIVVLLIKLLQELAHIVLHMWEATEAQAILGVLTLVESGEGVALVPAGVRYLRTRGVVFRRLEPETARVGVSLVWNPETLGILQQDFLALVRANKERIRRSDGD